MTQSLSKKKNLDCGCGKGNYRDCFNGECLGLDINLENLRIAKQKYNQVIRASIKCLPFKSNTFDFTLLSEVIEHVPKKDGHITLSELFRVSRQFVITTPNRNKLYTFLARLFYGSENPDHVSFWTRKDLKKMGLNVYGCLGWVTANRINFQHLASLWDLLAWYLPEIFAGDLIGIRIK